jgi:hypothetical protein
VLFRDVALAGVDVGALEFEDPQVADAGQQILDELTLDLGSAAQLRAFNMIGKPPVPIGN